MHWLLTTWSSAVLAQTFDASGPAQPPPRADITTPLFGFGGSPAEAMTVALTLEAASSTLVRELVDGEEVVVEPIVSSLFGANLAARGSVSRRLDLGLSAPVWLAVDGATRGATIGDLHVWAPVRLVDRGPADLAIVPFGRLPTGPDARYLGDPAGAGGLVSAGWQGGPTFAHADLGIDASAPTGAPDWAGGLRGRFALDAGVLIRQVALHAAWRGRAPLGQTVPSVPTEAALGLRVRPAPTIALSVTGGRAVTRGVGAGSMRLSAGLVFQPNAKSDAMERFEAPTPVVGHEVNVIDERRLPVRGAIITAGSASLTTDHEGFAALPLKAVRGGELTVSAPGYLPFTRSISVDNPYWEVQLQRAPVPVAVNVVGPDGPLDDAVVTIQGPGAPGEATIDEAGVQTWSLPQGSWQVAIEAPGFGRQERTIVIDEHRLDPVRVDAVLAAVEQPDTQLRVLVVDGLGRPVEDAVVAVENRDLGTTGSGGDLSVAGLSAGEHAIVVRSNRYGQAVVQQVNVGTDGEATVTVPLDWQAGSVLVKVVGPDGRPTDAEVRFRGPEALPARTVGADGEELFVLRPGVWSVDVSSDALSPQTRELLLDDQPGQVVQLDLVLQPAEGGSADLDLRVVDPNGAPVEGLDVSLDGKAVGRTGPDGALTLRALHPGVRFVEVKGDLVVPRLTEVELVSSRQREDVVIWWVDGVVDLSATDGEGRPINATVSPFGAAAYPPFELGTDGFERRVFAPGTWAVQVEADGFSPRARQLDVAEGTHRRQIATFRLEPPAATVGRLTLWIRDPEGQAVPRAEVWLDGQPAGEATGGFFQLDGVPLGPVDVRVRATAMTEAQLSSTLDGSTELSIAPAWAPGAARVRVHDAAGAATEAQVEAVGDGRRLVAEATDGLLMLALTPGSWSIRAVSANGQVAEREVTLPESPGLTQVDLVLSAPVVTLDVRGPDDLPVAGAEVRADGVVLGVTSSSGQLQLDAMPEGARALSITPPDPSLAKLDVTLRPDAKDTNYNLVLPLAPKSVEVRAVDTNGAPVQVELIASGAQQVKGQASATGGTLELAPGAWSVTARDAEGRVGTASVIVPVGAGSSAVEVVVAKVTSREQAGVLRPESPMLFDLDSAALRPDTLLVLDDLARWLQADRSLALVEVAGHTDDQGGVVYNQQLSEQRALAVRAALVARGVAPERLIARGYGLSRPLLVGQDDQTRQANRRVELTAVRRSGE